MAVTHFSEIDVDVLKIGGVEVGTELAALDGLTASVAELNYIDTSVPGTAVASKAAVLGANKNLDEFHTAALYLGAAAGTLVTATAAELNELHSQAASAADFAKLHAVTATAAQINVLGAVAITRGTAAPSSGTHVKGEICLNSDPDDGEAWGWVCVTAGTAGGTWHQLGTVLGS
jgi:hypothetical protein